MGNSKSMKVRKDADNLFGRERRKEQRLQEKKMKMANPANKRVGVNVKEPVVQSSVMLTQPHSSSSSAPAPAPTHVRAYDAEALDRMRYQLNNDANAFLLNNILLSVQFFENYEKELQHIKSNPISERERLIDEAMVPHHKHVFFADRLQECVQEHVSYQRNRGQLEPLSSPRMFVIYDNVEASEPGDTSDYSAVLDAPFYKLRIEDCKEPGYVMLEKLEILESTVNKETDDIHPKELHSDDSIYIDSEKESNDSDEISDDCIYGGKGNALLQKIETKLKQSQKVNNTIGRDIKIDQNPAPYMGRRGSGPIKELSSQASRSKISNLDVFRKTLPSYLDEDNADTSDETNLKKTVQKNFRKLSGPVKELKNKAQNIDAKMTAENQIAEDPETSGYGSNSSSRQAEFSETESDYGYTTITHSTTPKKVQMSVQSANSLISGVLTDECWIPLQVKVIDNWNEDEDQEIDDSASQISSSQNLYDTNYYLNSISFMANFVDNFMAKLGSALGLNQDAINNALTQGASIYCDTFKNGAGASYEIFPALLAAWPNAANPWIIRERRIIQNPRTNFTYQWPTKYMVSKAIGFGCLLIPIGFRPKRGLNPNQNLQWRIIFPAAERYLESNLAHCHMRCYLFTIALHKTFLENQTLKIGLDASHIKNHLFWECENNYAKWPEDRLGETLRLFLKSFYSHFRQNRFSNYFIETCNDFKTIPQPILLKLQRKLADILEAPVMHVLHAIDKIKYNRKDFYPPLNCSKLYEILTSKNPLRIINPATSTIISNVSEDSEDDEPTSHTNIWERAKANDSEYQWKKKIQRQIQVRKKAITQSKKQRTSIREDLNINHQIILPSKMETERRRLVLEFFIPHFIAMARSSEKFEAINQAVIYLEQARRLCILLSEEPSGEISANDYLDVISDKLADCQRKLVDQSGYKLPHRKESHVDRAHYQPRKQRPTYANITGKDSPTDAQGFSVFTFVDVHVESNNKDSVKFTDITDTKEESQL